MQLKAKYFKNSFTLAQEKMALKIWLFDFQLVVWLGGELILLFPWLQKTLVRQYLQASSPVAVEQDTILNYFQFQVHQLNLRQSMLTDFIMSLL